MNLDLSKLGLLEISDEIDFIITEYKSTKNKKLRKTICENYLILVNEYHNRIGNKNIYHKSLENIK